MDFAKRTILVYQGWLFAHCLFSFRTQYIEYCGQQNRMCFLLLIIAIKKPVRQWLIASFILAATCLETHRPRSCSTGMALGRLATIWMGWKKIDTIESNQCLKAWFAQEDGIWAFQSRGCLPPPKTQRDNTFPWKKPWEEALEKALQQNLQYMLWAGPQSHQPG